MSDITSQIIVSQIVADKTEQLLLIVVDQEVKGIPIPCQDLFDRDLISNSLTEALLPVYVLVPAYGYPSFLSFF